MRAILKDNVASLELAGKQYQFTVRKPNETNTLMLLNEAVYGDPSPECLQFCRSLAKLAPVQLPTDEWSGDLLLVVGDKLQTVRYTTEECLLLSN